MSFGSAVKPSQMTKERRAIFLDVFSQLGEQFFVVVFVVFVDVFVVFCCCGFVVVVFVVV